MFCEFLGFVVFFSTEKTFRLFQDQDLARQHARLEDLEEESKEGWEMLGRLVFLDVFWNA